MAVQALKDYQFSPADSQDKFHGGQLLYIGWDDHLMFCAPFAYCLPPDTPFLDLCEKILPNSFGYHPDWAKVDFTKATWLKSGQPCCANSSRVRVRMASAVRSALAAASKPTMVSCACVRQPSMKVAETL